MSKSTHLSLAQIIVTPENVVEQLGYFDYDEDLNGNNGSEFLSDEAKTEGFDSDVGYYLDLVDKHVTNLTGEERVNEAVDKMLGLLTDNSFYEGSDMNVIKVNDEQFVVAFLNSQTC